MPPLAFFSQHEHNPCMRIWLPALFLLAAGCTPSAPADSTAAKPEPGVVSSGMQTAAAAASLRNQAGLLSQQVARFRMAT